MEMVIIDYRLEEEDISENGYTALPQFLGRNSAVQPSVTWVDSPFEKEKHENNKNKNI